MNKQHYYIINGITLYRLVTAPLLVYLAYDQQLNIFRWLLVLSFFTDAIDGFLARQFKIVSMLGSKLDSIADDLTVVAAMFGVLAFNRNFLEAQILYLGALFLLFLIENGLALARYKKRTSFHTYLAKVAAVVQGLFLILFFFLPEPPYLLFFVALAITALDLIEEIILVLLLPEWRHDVKGLYWILRDRKQNLNK